MSGPMLHAKWNNGTKTLTGRWQYKGSDRFVIALDSVDPVTGQERNFSVYGDSPEWGNWKLDRSANKSKSESSGN